jgi:PhnB protein
MFHRSCAEALKVYAAAFGGEIVEMQRYGDVPAPGFQVPEEDKALVLHARLRLGGTEIQCADAVGGVTAGDNMYLSVTMGDLALMQSAWESLKAGGEVYPRFLPLRTAPCRIALASIGC